MKKLLWVLAAAIALLAGAASTQSIESIRLTDTIDKGAGNVDLLKNVSAAALEGYRQANDGRLVFGIDINEAANGTEKASAQGVAISDAWLEVRFADGRTAVYGRAGGFFTETQAVLAPAGQTARASYYTALGESGSSRITANGAIQSAFDSTIKIVVPDSLAGVVSAVLRVRLLDPNVKLGDPEAFYDFTAGFEDLAILSPADARYLDTVLPLEESSFRSEAPAMELSPQGETTLASLEPAPAPPAPLTWLSRPGTSEFYLAAYEDLAPERGDYDFNDAVVAWRWRLGVNAQGLVERIEGEAWLVARGSTYRHAWTLDIPLPAAAEAAAGSGCSTVTPAAAALPCSVAVEGGRLRWQAFTDTVAALPAATGAAAQPVNTPAGTSFLRGARASFAVVLATPVEPPAAGAGDPWLRVQETGREVRLADRNADGYPFALLLPQGWRVPTERTDTGLAYPRLATFVASGGIQATDWYLQPGDRLTQSWTASDWAW